MSDRVYNRIANILMLVGIGSAVLFDSGKVPHSVAGGIGILAGVGAIALYFFNKGEAAEQEKKDVGSVGEREVRPRESEAEVQERVISILRQTDWERVLARRYGHSLKKSDAMAAWYCEALGSSAYDVEDYRRQIARVWSSHYAMHHARTLRWHVAKDASLALMQPEVESSPNEVAACALAIVWNLSIADKFNEWEYTLGPKGLKVSIKSFRPDVPSRSSQEDFDFERFSTLIS
jgi:hypothetical protein